MAAKVSVAETVSRVAETVRGLDIPVVIGEESGPFHPGINVWRMTRTNIPSREYPYRGTLVTVMFGPESESEDRFADRVVKTAEEHLEGYV